METTKRLSTRDFLKLSTMLTVSGLVVACKPVARLVATVTPTSGSNSTDIVPPTQTDVATQTFVPKDRTPKVWKLSLAERVKLMSKPEFFTKLQGKNTRKIITLQWDKSEYVGLKREVSMINTCHQSALTTVNKAFEYLETGIVPDVINADVYAKLEGETTIIDGLPLPVEYITKYDTMYFAKLGDAAKLLIPQLISKTELLTSYKGHTYGIFPQEYWPDLLSKAQVICELAGITMITGSWGGGAHTVVGTDVKEDGTAIVVNSYTGTAERVHLNNFFETRVNPEPKSVRRQTVLYSMIGILPKLNDSG